MRNFHRLPFSVSTQVKLRLFRDYTREWIPVWVSQVGRNSTITIADFFAGPGADCEGSPGSPLIVLDELQQSSDLIRSKGARVNLILNEYVAAKAQVLENTMKAQGNCSSICTWKILGLGFEEAFQEVYPSLCSGPNLLILDQQGMKAISDDVFKMILRLPRTDFLFFIASSSIRRFENNPYFQKHLDIPSGAITGATFNDTHRAVTEHYRSLATECCDNYFLSSFSIKKGSNIYGLVFGSHHHVGLLKFLRVCWKADPVRGEANFDIDSDQYDPNEPHLFAEMDRPKKLTVFQDITKSKILAGCLASDREVYLHTLQEGFLPSEGKKVLRSLLRNGHIRVLGGQARVSPEGFKSPRRLEVLRRD